MSRHLLVGSWVLDSIQFADSSDGVRYDMYGPEPSGYLMVSADGVAMANVASSDRKPPQKPEDTVDLFRTMMCYAGTCRVEGNKFITKVEAAWHPAWIGTEQVRYYEISGNSLAITTAEQTHPNYPGKRGRGIVMWHRAVPVA